MSKVKVLYVRNLTQEISEEKLKVSVKIADLLAPKLTPFKLHFRKALRTTEKWNVLKKLKTTLLFISKTATTQCWL